MEESQFFIDEQNNKLWYLPSKGKRYYHRLDGPAIEFSNGAKHWFVNGKRHRIDGYAVIDICGPNQWWINGNMPSGYEVKEWLEDNKVDLKTLEGQMAFKLRWI